MSKKPKDDLEEFGLTVKAGERKELGVLVKNENFWPSFEPIDEPIHGPPPDWFGRTLPPGDITLFVRDNGDDVTGCGSEERPFKTLTRAQRAIPVEPTGHVNIDVTGCGEQSLRLIPPPHGAFLSAADLARLAGK